MKKLNKFEKTYLISSTLIVAGVFGNIFINLMNNPTLQDIIFSLVLIAFYIWVDRLIFNSLNRKEQQFLMNNNLNEIIMPKKNISIE